MMSTKLKTTSSKSPSCTSLKLQKIIEWIIKNADYFESAQFAKIVLNLKNENIVGEINIFPDHKV